MPFDQITFPAARFNPMIQRLMALRSRLGGMQGVPQQINPMLGNVISGLQSGNMGFLNNMRSNIGQNVAQNFRGSIPGTNGSLQGRPMMPPNRMPGNLTPRVPTLSNPQNPGFGGFRRSWGRG